MDTALAQGMENPDQSTFTPHHVRQMKNPILQSIIAIMMLSFLIACSGGEDDETSPLDDQPVPAPEKPDIPQ